VPPGPRRQVETPDRRVAQVVLAEPVPAVVAGEGAKAEEAIADRVKNVLLHAAGAGRREVGVDQREGGRQRIVGPGLVLLLVAAALSMAGPAYDLSGQWVKTKRGFIAEHRVGRPAGKRTALHPGHRRLLQPARLLGSRGSNHGKRPSE